jgi:penicillin-binding protein
LPILRLLHPRETDGLEEVGFPLPRGAHPVRLCALTGKLAAPACDHVVIEHFTEGTEPVEPCRAHQMLAVDSRNGLLASPATPTAYVQVRRFVDLAPRYAEWQAARGLLPPPTQVSMLDEGSRASGWTPAPILGAGRLHPAAAQTARVRITAPRPGLRIVRDPESPPSTGSLTLSAAVDPAVDQVVWYVDGKPFRVADWPYTVRWPIEAGVHTIQARLPFVETASEAVKLTVY